jgi:hypothetical protein
VVDVVHEPDLDAALLRRQEGREHQSSRVGLEADVVEREVERARRAGEELRRQARDRRRRLSAVAEGGQLDAGRLDRQDTAYVPVGRVAGG